MAFNDLFCLSRPEVHTLSIGAARVDDFDEHLVALERYDLRERLLPGIVERLMEEARRVLGDSWMATWKEGLPPWEKTPGLLNVPVILFLWNLAKAFGMEEYGKMRYNLMGNGSHWFPGGRPDPLHLDSPEMPRSLRNSPHAQKIPAILREAHEMFSGKEVRRLGKDEA
jgi:predicted aldo/keto reductase-like oxidoreductase